MCEILKDAQGRKIGEIKNEYGKLVVYNHLGIKLGYYDGTYTYEKYGRRIGYGNLLAIFLKDYINI